MVQIPSLEEIGREYAEQSFRAHLHGKQRCSEKWIAGVVRAVDPSTAKRVLSEVGQKSREIHPRRVAYLERLVNPIG
jgi:hypothetical protein